MSDCHFWAFLLAPRWKISAELRLFSIMAKDFDHVGESNQDFVAPALCHIPIEVVSVRVREHQHQDRTGRERVWMRKFEGGRSGTKWNCATEHERQRWRDEKTQQERVWSNMQSWGTNPGCFLRKNDLPLEFWAEEIAILLGNSSIFNTAINKNSPRLNRNRSETDRIHIQSKTNDRNKSTTGQLYNKESRMITTVITSSKYWRVLINAIGILKIPEEFHEKGRNVVSILCLLNIFHSILDSHWLS